MKIGIRMDYDWESRIEEVINPLQEAIKIYFEARNYGNELTWISIIFNCRSGPLLKERKKYDKNDKLLMYDIISDFNLVSSLSGQAKKDVILKLFRNSIITIKQYNKKIVDFNFDKFEKDWEDFFDVYS